MGSKIGILVRLFSLLMVVEATTGPPALKLDPR
jgi:hypothetical protein